VEVSYSQKRKVLERIAEEYILGSNGDICVVIGLDIEYSGKMATLSIWRPRVVDTEAKEELLADLTVADLVFRNDDGSPNTSPGSGLYLSLRDFATHELVSQFQGLDDTIFIPSGDLCAILCKAEQHSEVLKQRKGVARPPNPRLKKRRRKSSSPEQLDEDHERIFEDAESREVKRVA